MEKNNDFIETVSSQSGTLYYEPTDVERVQHQAMRFCLRKGLCPNCQSHPKLKRKSWKDYFNKLLTCPLCGFILAGQ